MLKILTDFYCAVSSFTLLRSCPNLTVWILILNPAAWLRVHCAWNSWQKRSEMCLEASRHKSHAIPLKNGVWKHRFGAVLEQRMLIIPSDPDYAFHRLWGWMSQKFQGYNLCASQTGAWHSALAASLSHPGLTVVMPAHPSTKKPGEGLGPWRTCRKGSHQLLFFPFRKNISPHTPLPQTRATDPPLVALKFAFCLHFHLKPHLTFSSLSVFPLLGSSQGLAYV